VVDQEGYGYEVEIWYEVPTPVDPPRQTERRVRR
jgi:hypothetical protein